ncbi:MAG: phage tail protein, partial [Ignavibacteria bacterium]|nr:phage tail protein [Ignavibacteria bacterium]
MPLVSSSIPNLINGVSQQPAALRLSSQAESVINCFPSPVEGLKKRPPSYNLGKLFSGSSGTGRPFVNIVDRDGTIRYMVYIRDGDIKVFDLNGAAQTVTVPDGVGYLDINNASDPSAQFRVASVADATFIVNREKTVSMLDGVALTSSAAGTTTTAVFASTTGVSVGMSVIGPDVPY